MNKTIAISAAFLLSTTLTANAQGVKDTFSLTTKSAFDQKLFRADSLLRSQDAVSSLALFNNPCGCFYEMNHLAPGNNHKNFIPYYQTAAAYAIKLSYNYMYKHNHKRIARGLLIGDVLSETFAVTNNYYLINKGVATNSKGE